MIPDDHAIMMYKFGEYRWIQKIINGELSFSCPGAFIAQVKKTGNKIQGDELEGVFARQHKDNPKIIEIRNKLGEDLEEIIDGDYIFFRRKSCKFVPIFCLFAYTAKDAILVGKPNKIGKQKVKLEFDQRLFEGFANESIKNVVSDSHRFTLAFLQPREFVNRVKIAMITENKPYKMEAIEYKDIHNGEFYIEPTDDYPELFLKSEEYEYQHEARICLTGEMFSSIFQRYSLNIGKFNDRDYELAYSDLWIEYTAFFDRMR